MKLVLGKGEASKIDNEKERIPNRRQWLERVLSELRLLAIKKMMRAHGLPQGSVRRGKGTLKRNGKSGVLEGG